MKRRACKEPLTGTADPDLVAKDGRLRAMAEAVAAYEAEFGAISAAEIESQQRADQRNAVVVGSSARK
jgi:hypothetical protein